LAYSNFRIKKAKTKYSISKKIGQEQGWRKDIVLKNFSLNEK